MAFNHGTLVISLDCELMWGVRDEVNKDSYGQHILGDHKVIPRLLELFEKYKIKGTFAYVGFLFCASKPEILQHRPTKLPGYKDQNLSPYGDYILREVGNSFDDDPYNFGWPQIELISSYPDQEIATHTFSHYYCLEQGQTPEEFEADLAMALTIAKEKGIAIHSIIFPRNQVSDPYLKICRQLGINYYRGTEQSWIYSARSLKKESLVRRFTRLMDAYINLSGQHCYTQETLVQDGLVNIASSRFLRPYSKRLKPLENLRLKRITDAMTYAAKHRKLYHLWWHPHNFGINQDENFAFLEKILIHYQFLHKKYGFASETMKELGEELLADEKR
jgi:peptidoglycan/xylan/chitin deacetylase (PgdA/CDA1 family)